MGDPETQRTASVEHKTMRDASDNVRDVLTSQELYEAFARNLRYLLEKKGFASPHDLADKIPRFSENTLYGWLNLEKPDAPRDKKSYPRLDLLERVAERLNCEIWELFHPDLDGLRKDIAELERIRKALQGDDERG